MIKKWALKALVQKSISYLPASHKINFLFQKYITKGVQLSDEYFYDRLGHAREHIGYFGVFGKGTIPSSTLELGTGWYPVVPVALFLSGSQNIQTLDIEPLCSKERLLTTLKKYKEAHVTNKLVDFLKIKNERWQILENVLQKSDNMDFKSILEKLNIHYTIQDACQTYFKEQSFDLIHSNNVFEHIYPDILNKILVEFKRILNKESGVQSHFIDMSDHFAHADSSINIYHFLRYSTSQWERIDNSIQPQNRWRMQQYLILLDQLGFKVLHQTHRPGDEHEVLKTKIHVDFKIFTNAQIAASHCHLVFR